MRAIRRFSHEPLGISFWLPILRGVTLCPWRIIHSEVRISYLDKRSVTKCFLLHINNFVGRLSMRTPYWILSTVAWLCFVPCKH